VGRDSAFRIELSQRQVTRVLCAPEQIKQVLVNLVQNSAQSLKQSPPAEGGVIRMGSYAERRSRDGALEAVLYVEDNGRGIPRDNIDKIFIPFFTTSPGGTGLGLPICSRIIEAHGGRIDVMSDEGKFTRFSVHLPIKEA
jgi:signal transduction histidine kinase